MYKEFLILLSRFRASLRTKYQRLGVFIRKLRRKTRSRYRAAVRKLQQNQRLIQRIYKRNLKKSKLILQKKHSRLKRSYKRVVRFLKQRPVKWRSFIRKQKRKQKKTVKNIKKFSIKKVAVQVATQLFTKARVNYQRFSKNCRHWLLLKLPWLRFSSQLKIRQFLSKLKQKTQPFFQKFFSPNWCRLYAALGATCVILVGSWWVYTYIFADLPDPLDLTRQTPAMTTRILDRNGNLLYRIYQDENRTIVPLSEISQHMINATIAIEDQSFYQHHGFSFRGITRALVRNLKDDQIQGGSTITQQLVKNRLLDSEKTFQRKAKELILSILVEGTYTKEEILQMYLNEVSYGGSTYGVEEAAWRMFNKPAKDLSLGESALLAGLPAAPSIYSPFGPNPELSLRRQEEVIRRMVEDGYISLEDAYLASQEKLEFRPDVIDIQAPHFVMHVKKLLADKFGEKMVHQGGLEVRTSLDLNLQQQVQQIVTEQISLIERLRISNGAALVTNPQTGEILAMVGSKNYFDFEHDGQVNVTIRPRQPGSSIKPLTYALAFETGKRPWDYIDDSPITYQIPGSRPYSPRNYDGQFRGRVTLRQALASSYNIPAVKLLASLGVENLVEKGREMGISTWADSSRFGLSLTLGAGEVLMTDLAQVYGTFATGGYTLELDPFLEIRDYQGNLLYRNPCFAQPDDCREFQTLDPIVAYQLNDILSDDQARSSTFGYYSLLNIPRHQVAVKTGTTNDKRDNWAVGYVTDRLVAVWVGNNDNSPMSYVASGMSGASPIWHEIIKLLLDDQNLHQFVLAPELIKVRICVPTNTLPCAGCPLVVEEIFVKGQEPTQACDWRFFIKTEEEEQLPIGERARI